MTYRFSLPKVFSLLLTIGTPALLPACAGPNRAEQLAAQRPAFVRVVSRYASAPERREDCRMTFAAQEPGAGQRLRKLAALQLTGPKLDRPQAEKLLAAKACTLGAATLHITDEAYGTGEERGSVEATAYAFHSPVQILLSGLDVDAEAKPLSCRILYFRTQRPEAPYDEIAGLNLNVKAAPTALGMTSTTSQATMLDELRQAACHLGADAIVISKEDYDVPTLGSRVSGTAILFRENRERRPAPGSQEL